MNSCFTWLSSRQHASSIFITIPNKAIFTSLKSRCFYKFLRLWRTKANVRVQTNSDFSRTHFNAIKHLIHERLIVVSGWSAIFPLLDWSWIEINSTPTVTIIPLTDVLYRWYSRANRHFCMNIVLQYTTWDTEIVFYKTAPWYKRNFNKRSMLEFFRKLPKRCGTSSFHTNCCQEILITTCIFTIAIKNICRNISFANIDIGFKSFFWSFQLIRCSLASSPIFHINL